MFIDTDLYIDGPQSLQQTSKTPKVAFKRRMNSIQITPHLVSNSRAVLQTLLPDIEEHDQMVEKLKTLDR